MEIIKIKGLAETEIQLVQECHETKKLLIQQTSQLQKIEDKMDSEDAGRLLHELSAILNAVENARKEVKAPVLEMGRKIDTLAKDFSNELDAEKTRLQRILGQYQLMERERIKRAEEEALAKARAELMKAQEEAQKVQEKAFEQAEASSDAVATELIATASADALKIHENAVVKAQEHYAPVEALKASQPSDIGVRVNLTFEVTDIDALFSARPDLCIIGPDNAAIRAAIKKQKNIPGIKIIEEVKAVTTKRK